MITNVHNHGPSVMRPHPSIGITKCQFPGPPLPSPLSNRWSLQRATHSWSNSCRYNPLPAVMIRLLLFACKVISRAGYLVTQGCDIGVCRDGITAPLWILIPDYQDPNPSPCPNKIFLWVCGRYLGKENKDLLY
ncbi:hypothetical protein CDAR_42971 [Caerostris darwini]|uniref:Uncharacterized protein n=1 Tax=Caerostris darwini TaxID=1538125 RepID=A0AAV4WG55_9ARAC|nr:hypothetical protein CDAR_42971 [Caerostris darwini]